MRKARVSVQTNDSILSCYMGGGTFTEISKEHNLSDSYVSSLVKVFSLVRDGKDRELAEQVATNRSFTRPVLEYCYAKCRRTMPTVVADAVLSRETNSRGATKPEIKTPEMPEMPDWAVELARQNGAILTALNAILGAIKTSYELSHKDIAQLTADIKAENGLMMEHIRKETDALFVPLSDCIRALECIKVNTRGKK